MSSRKQGGEKAPIEALNQACNSESLQSGLEAENVLMCIQLTQICQSKHQVLLPPQSPQSRVNEYKWKSELQALSSDEEYVLSLSLFLFCIAMLTTQMHFNH